MTIIIFDGAEMRKVLILLTLVNTGIAIAGDVRVKGMGNVDLNLRDTERDCFDRPFYLNDVRNSVVIGGLGLDIYDKPNDEGVYQWGAAYSQTGIRSEAGYIAKPNMMGTAFAIKAIANTGNNYNIAHDYAVISLRAAQKLGFLGIGAGYDRMVDDRQNYQQGILGGAIGRPGNKMSFNFRFSAIDPNSSVSSIDLIWERQLCPWFGFGVKGLKLWDNDKLDEYYRFGAGLRIGIPKLSTDIYSEGGIRKYKKENDLINELEEKEAFSYFGRMGIETWIRPWWALRGGMSNVLLDKILLSQDNNVENGEAIFSMGTTLKIKDRINIEYSYEYIQNEFEMFTCYHRKSQSLKVLLEM
jgi:hypothetical protein